MLEEIHVLNESIDKISMSRPRFFMAAGRTTLIARFLKCTTPSLTLGEKKKNSQQREPSKS